MGPESTGKTTLAKALAKHFKTLWVPEFAREFLTELDRPYEKKDLIDMAKGQLKAEKQYRKKAKNLLILDTDLFVIKIWSEFKYGTCDPWILQQLAMDQANFYFLTHYDVPYEEDPLRESPGKRPELFKLYESALKEAGAPYFILKGPEEKRLDLAVKRINSIL